MLITKVRVAMFRRSLFFILSLFATTTLAANDCCFDIDCPDPACPSLSNYCRKYNLIRFEEDWSFLACQDCEDCFDGIKYIPFCDCSDSWIGFGASFRAREETWRDFNFTAGADDEFFLTRLFLYTDWHPTSWSRLYVQINSAWISDRDLPGSRRIFDMDPVNLQNAFVEFTFCDCFCDAITLRLGRQEMLFGSHRLVFPRNWTNTRRTFDGARVNFCVANWSVDAWYHRKVRIEKYSWNGASSEQFYGLWAEGCVTDYFPLAVYFLGRERGDAKYNGMTEAEKRYTLGLWSKGEIPFFCDSCLMYDAELAYQFGDFGPYDISAYMAVLYLGYQFENYCFKPEYWMGFDYASGDKASTGTVETFSQTYPKGHGLLGYVDVIGRQNTVHLGHSLFLHTPCKTKLELSSHTFWRAKTTDGLYSPADTLSRPAGSGLSSYVGTELDVFFTWQMDCHLKSFAGYGHFWPGTYIKDVDPSRKEDIDHYYIGFEYTI